MTSGTFGTERNLTALFQATYSTYLNAYQTNFRVDHSAPELRQGASFKCKSDENNTGYVWTTDGWATYNAYRQASSGDPDCVWSASGDFLITYIDKSGGGLPNKVKIAAGGGSTLGSPISVSGVKVDYPHIFMDQSNGYLYFVGTNTSRNGVTVSYSTDNGATWTVSNTSFGTAINGGFTSCGCVTNLGTILLPQTTLTTTLVSGGVYNGSTTDLYVLRSTNQAVTWSSILVGDVDCPKTFGPGSADQVPVNMCHYNGRVHWAKYGHASGQPTKAYYGYSDDDGLTWTWNSTAFDVPSGYGMGSVWIGAAAGVLVAHAIVYNSSISWNSFLYCSYDRGVTWERQQTNPTLNTFSGLANVPRAPGDDQNDCDIVDGKAYFIWPDNRSATTYNQTYTRDWKYNMAYVFTPSALTSAAIQTAINAAVTAGGGVVDLGSDTYVCTSTITLDPSLVSLYGRCAVLNSSTGSQTVLLKVAPSASATAHNHACNTIEGISFRGTGSGGTQSAVEFDGTGSSGSSARGNMRNCDIENFKYGIAIRDNAYCNKFYTVDIRGVTHGIRTFSGGTNRGENIAFFGCTIGNGVCVYQEGHSVDMYFYACSFDFPGTSFVYADDHVSFFGCHFEDAPAGSTSKNAFQLDNNAYVRISGGLIGYSTGSASGLTLFKIWGSGGQVYLDNVIQDLPPSSILSNTSSVIYTNMASPRYFINDSLPPVNTGVPTITGTAQTGTALTAVTGTWTGGGTKSFQWQLETGVGSNVYADISGATSSTYTPITGQIGKKIRLSEKDDNTAGPTSGGVTWAYSTPTAAVISGSTDIILGTATTWGSSTDATTYTTSGIGSVASDEYALVGVYVRNATAPTISSVTINGSSMTQLGIMTTGGSRVAIYIGPYGVSGEVTVNVSATSLRCGITHVPVKNLQSTTPVATSTSNVDPASVSIDVSAGGAIFGMVANAASGTYSWSGVSELIDTTVESNTFTLGASVFSSAVTGQAVAADFSTTVTNQAGSFVSLR